MKIRVCNKWWIANVFNGKYIDEYPHAVVHKNKI